MFRKTVVCMLAVVVLALGGRTWAAEKGEKGEKAAVKAEKRPQQRQGQFMQGQNRQGRPNAAPNQIRMQAWVGEFTKAYRQNDQEKMEQLISRLNKAGEQSGPPVSRVAKAITDAYEQKDRAKMEQILRRMKEGMGRMQEQRDPGADMARPQERGPMRGRGPDFEGGGRERFQSPIGPQQPEPEMLRQFGQRRMDRQQQAPWAGQMAPERFAGRKQRQPDFNVRAPGMFANRRGRQPQFGLRGQGRFGRQGKFGQGIGNRFGMQQPSPDDALRQFRQRRMEQQGAAPMGRGYNYPMWQIPRGNFQW